MLRSSDMKLRSGKFLNRSIPTTFHKKKRSWTQAHIPQLPEFSILLGKWLNVSLEKIDQLEAMLLEHKACIAGSFPLWHAMQSPASWQPNDIDIFLCSTGNKTMHVLCSWMKQHLHAQEQAGQTTNEDNDYIANGLKTTLRTMSVNKRIIQLVSFDTDLISVHKLIIEWFDLDICTLQWPVTEMDQKHNSLIFSHAVQPRVATFRANYEPGKRNRWKKYRDRGFEFKAMPTMQHMEADMALFLQCSTPATQELRNLLLNQHAIFSGSFPLWSELRRVRECDVRWMPTDLDIFMLSSDAKSAERKLGLFEKWINTHLTDMKEEPPCSTGDNQQYDLEKNWDTAIASSLEKESRVISYSTGHQKKKTDRRAVQLISYVVANITTTDLDALYTLISRRFDLNICTLLWPLPQNEFPLCQHNASLVQTAVQTRVATYSPFVNFPKGRIDPHTRFAERMSKYASRGFTFSNLPTHLSPKAQLLLSESKEPREAKQLSIVRAKELEPLLDTLLTKHPNALSQYERLVRGDALNRGGWPIMSVTVDKITESFHPSLCAELKMYTHLEDEKQTPSVVRLLWEMSQMWLVPQRDERMQLMQLCKKLDIGPFMPAEAYRPVDLYALWKIGAHKHLSV